MEDDTEPQAIYVLTTRTETEDRYGLVWYGIVEFNVPLDTV